MNECVKHWCENCEYDDEGIRCPTCVHSDSIGCNYKEKEQ